MRKIIEKSFNAFDDLVEDAEKAEEEGDEEWLEEIEDKFIAQLDTVKEYSASNEPEDRVVERLGDGEKLSVVIRKYKEERLENLMDSLPF